jgi:hypothetical protein
MDNEAIPYRSPVTTGPAEPVSTQDENDYSTLREVQKEFNDAMNALFNDFNAFELAADPNLGVQVAGRQYAYELLLPLQTKVNSAIDDINAKQKG